MVMLAIIAPPLVWNLYFRKLAKSLEIIGAACYVLLFIVTIALLAVNGRWSNSKFVWNSVTTGVSGWNNPVLCWGLGLITVAAPMTGESDKTQSLLICYILTLRYNSL
jgi:hypothetical protein